VLAVSAHPQRLRRIAAAGSLMVAGVYGLIAIDVITVMEDQATTSPAPPLVAAAAFTMLAVLLLLSARRGVLLFGVVLQATSIAVYLMVSTRREPAFEEWGIGLKITQLLLLSLFVWLLRAQATTRPIPEPTEAPAPAQERVSEAGPA
jgi:phosphatidylserine synthase